jgi:hypothetical protein
MSTSLRNKFLLLLVGFFVGAKIVSAKPIDSITVVAPATVSAGQANTATVIAVFDEDSAAPTTAETITIESANNDFESFSFTTTPGQTSYGGVFTSIPLTFFEAGTAILTARTNSGVSGFDTLTVNAGNFTKLIVVGPGQTLDEGRDPTVNTTGRTGSATSPVVNSTFGVTVFATDDQYNAVAGSSMVTLSAGSHVPELPLSQALSGGQTTFTVSIDAPKITETFTATASGLTTGSANVTSAGPEAEKVNAFPSPFNPHTGTVKFQYVVDSVKSVTLKVTDQFGQAIWEKSSTGVPNTLNIEQWDGKNDRGTVVAAGVYYVLLEVSGELKSKKKFGVTK